MNPADLYGPTAGIDADLYIKVIGIVIVLLVLILLYRFRKAGGGKSDSLETSRGLDLISLKKKGLLTPEELERVGQAMLRQMEQKDQAQRRRTVAKSADDLLLDPEVRRLEALAVARKTDPQNQQLTPANASAVPADAFAATNPAPAPSQEASTVSEPAAPPALGGEDVSAVELPLDIQQLADAGLLSEEEVQNVKRRLLERRRQS